MGFKQMPLALRVPGLSDTQKLVLLAITDHANEDHGNSTFVGQGRIAGELGKARETVNRAVKVLDQQGYITREQNYRTTEDGRSYRSSDTIIVHYAAMQKAVDNSDNPSVDSKSPVTTPSDLTSLPLVTTDQHPSDEKSLPLVISDHGGSDAASQLNRELNREPEQGSELGSETGNLTFTLTASGEERGRSKAVTTDTGETPAYAATRRAVQDAAEAQDMEIFTDALTEYFEEGERLSEYAQNRWSKIPLECADAYSAGRWLKVFLRTASKRELISTEQIRHEVAA